MISQGDLVVLSCSSFYVSLLDACALLSSCSKSIDKEKTLIQIKRRCGYMEESTIGERGITKGEEEVAKRSLWYSLGCLAKNAISRTMSISMILFSGTHSFAILNSSTCLSSLFYFLCFLDFSNFISLFNKICLGGFITCIGSYRTKLRI